MSETTTVTLTDFLLARIAEREAAAKDRLMEVAPFRGGCRGIGCLRRADQPHAFGCPARVLAECARDRRIVALHSPVHVCTKDETGDDETAWDARYGSPCPTLRALASVYADHPEFREEWRL